MQPAEASLASGRLRCIGATTFQEYRAHLERDSALARRFQRIEIGEPSVEDTTAILRGLQKRYEDFHKVVFAGAALEAAAKLSARYLQDRRLPDKAIDLLDEAGAAAHLAQDDGYEVIRDRCRGGDGEDGADPAAPGLDVGQGAARDLEASLKAVDLRPGAAIEAARHRHQALPGGPTRPGQAHRLVPVHRPDRRRQDRARKAARAGARRGFLRFDMSEYQERHTVSRLIGAPPATSGSIAAVS